MHTQLPRTSLGAGTRGTVLPSQSLEETTPAVHYDTRAQLPSWPLEVTTPAVYNIHTLFPSWPLETAARSTTRTFFSIRPLGQMQVLPLEGQSWLQLASGPQKHLPPLAQNTTTTTTTTKRRPAPLGRSSRPRATGCDPLITLLGLPMAQAPPHFSV